MVSALASVVTLATYDPNDVKPGWIAFWLVVALGVATFLLWRSMNRQLRKIKAPYRDEVAADSTAPRSERSDGPGDAAETPSDTSPDSA
jgi:hypothetical protein